MTGARSMSPAIWWLQKLAKAATLMRDARTEGDDGGEIVARAERAAGLARAVTLARLADVERIARDRRQTEEKYRRVPSGRLLGRPTGEEIAASAASSRPESFIGADLPDGRHALLPDRKWYYEHFENGQPVWDRPVNLEDYETYQKKPTVARSR